MIGRAAWLGFSLALLLGCAAGSELDDEGLCSESELESLQLCFTTFLGHSRPLKPTTKDLTTPFVSRMANLSRDCRRFSDFSNCLKPNIDCIVPPANTSALKSYFSLDMRMVLDVFVQAYGKCHEITMDTADRRKFVSCYADWIENWEGSCGPVRDVKCGGLKEVLQCRHSLIKASCLMTDAANKLMCLLQVTSPCDPRDVCDQHVMAKPERDEKEVLRLQSQEVASSAAMLEASATSAIVLGMLFDW